MTEDIIINQESSTKIHTVDTTNDGVFSEEEVFMRESTEIDKARDHKFSIIAYLAAVVVLFASVIDMCIVPYKIIQLAVEGKLNNVDITVWGLIFLIYLFVNNLRLKAGAYLWGHTTSDTKIVNMVGNVMQSVGNKMNSQSK
jgi:hypothetical protein